MVSYQIMIVMIIDKFNREMCCENDMVLDPTFAEIPLGKLNRYILVLMIKTGFEGERIMKVRKVGIITNGELMTNNQRLNGEVRGSYNGRLVVPTSREMEELVNNTLRIIITVNAQPKESTGMSQLGNR